MKLTSLPIWSRIMRDKPRSCSSRERPQTILRIILENKRLRAKRRPGFDASYSPEIPLQWKPRAKRWTDAERDERRAANDPKFARILERREAAATRRRAIVLQIGVMYDLRVERLRGPSARGAVEYGTGSKGYTKWDGGAPKHYFAANPGVEERDGRIVLSPVRGQPVVIPL